MPSLRQTLRLSTSPHVTHSRSSLGRKCTYLVVSYVLSRCISSEIDTLPDLLSLLSFVIYCYCILSIYLCFFRGRLGNMLSRFLPGEEIKKKKVEKTRIRKFENNYTGGNISIRKIDRYCVFGKYI